MMAVKPPLDCCSGKPHKINGYRRINGANPYRILQAWWQLLLQGRACLTACFLPALVRTYNAGLSFALLFFLDRTHCSNVCIIVQFHHAFSGLARQPCPAALPRQPCSAAALPGSSLARQPCPAVLLVARQPCPAALLVSSTNFDRIWCARSLAQQSLHCTVLQWQVTKLHARAAAVLTGLNLFLVQFHHAFIICIWMRPHNCIIGGSNIVYIRQHLK
jgi:hypothetical protein